MTLRPDAIFGILASVVTATVVVVGLVLVGSPSRARMERLDRQRVQELKSITLAINSYRRTHQTLPDKMNELIRPNVFPLVRLKDPAGQPYEYRAKTALSYQLCAFFSTATDKSTLEAHGISPFWKHERGRQCFDLEARPPVQR